MPRERGKKRSLRKRSARKPLVGDLLEPNDSISDSDIGADGLDLRDDQHKQELGRNPRSVSRSVDDSLSRYKKAQAQKFSEHTPEADDAHNEEVISTNTLTIDAGQPNLSTQGSASVFDDSSSQSAEPQSLNDKSTDMFSHEDRQTVKPPRSDTLTKDNVLSHKRPSVLKQKRGRPSHKHTSPTPITSLATKSCKFNSDDASNYHPSSDRTSSSDVRNPIDRSKLRKKLEKAERKLERSSRKLQTAQGKLPSKRVLRTNKEFDAEKGKMKPRLRFEQEAKPQHKHLRGSIVTRPIKTAANTVVGFAHTKIFQVQEENVGVKAAHKGELLTEGGLRYAYRRHKTASYRKINKLQKKTSKLAVKASYRKTLHDNPKLAKKPLVRIIQKRRIKREYAKTVREAKRRGTFIKATSSVTQKAVNKLVTMLIKRNPKAWAVLAIPLLVLFLIFGMVSSCHGIASGIGQTFVAMSYHANDEDIDDAALLYSELETDLQILINSIEAVRPGFDEYRYEIDAIGHNPFLLISFLTAVYWDFTFTEVENTIREIFEEHYQLEFREEMEIRTRIETREGTGIDDEGNEYSYSYTVEVEYEWHILNIILTAQPFIEILKSRMEYEQLRHFSLLTLERGLRQIVLSPFDFDWLPFVSSPYGWRINPFTGEKERHWGVDIALPVGTEILAAHGGIVTFAGDMGDYGLVVFIDNGEGIVTVYAHCDALFVSTGQIVEAGDVIATVGNTGQSTGPHLHFEVIKNGRRLNPLFFALISRNSADELDFGFPGAPVDDERFAALITEAERLLGIKYVWGGSNPEQGFDCSGLVCFL